MTDQGSCGGDAGLIRSEDEYRFYLEADRVALGKKTSRPKFFGDEVWKFERLLRTVEYNRHRRSGWWWAPYRALINALFHLSGLVLKFTIPPGAFGPGLALANRGTIVVHPNATIGENCRIHIGVTIGAALEPTAVGPRLGNNVYIGPGAAIVGGVTIADDVAVGAKAVVVHSIRTPGVTVVGAPARTIGQKGSDQMIRATQVLRGQVADR